MTDRNKLPLRWARCNGKSWHTQCLGLSVLQQEITDSVRGGMVMIHDELISEYGSIEELDRAILAALKSRSETLAKISIDREIPVDFDGKEISK